MPAVRQKSVTNCLSCGELFHPCFTSKSKTFCSNQCFADFQWTEKKKLIETDQQLFKDAIKRYLLEKSPACFECGIEEWQDKPLTLQLDHIDGNPDNSRLSNCRLLCPNCHSQTETYKGGNKKTLKTDKVNTSRRDKRRVGGEAYPTRLESEQPIHLGS